MARLRIVVTQKIKRYRAVYTTVTHLQLGRRRSCYDLLLMHLHPRRQRCCMTPTTPHLLEALDAAFYGLTGRWAATLARGEAIGAVIKVPANGRKPVGYAVSWRNFDHESDAQFRLDAVRRNA